MGRLELINNHCNKTDICSLKILLSRNRLFYLEQKAVNYFYPNSRQLERLNTKSRDLVLEKPEHEVSLMQ